MDRSELLFSNYCVSVIDLLGQKDALSGEGLLPDLTDQNDYDAFVRKIKKSVGNVANLQALAAAFSNNTNPLPDEPNRTKELQAFIDEINKVPAKQQRWSDGLVYFSSLQQETNKCPMEAVFEIFSLTGSLCLLGLASGQPIRGAIEVSWGVEINEGEIYGPALAKAYELENTVAQYPRIVIGDFAHVYLQSFLEEEINTKALFSLHNRNLAAMCLEMLIKDKDGHYILDYLGPEFTAAVTQSKSKELYQDAYQFLSNQYETHRNNRNSKLSIRYAWLKDYFHEYKHIHTS